MATIAFSTMFAENQGFTYLLKVLRRGVGVGVFEYHDEGPMRLTRRRVMELKTLRRSMGLTFNLHAPYVDVNPAAVDDAVYNRAREMLLAAVEHAVELESSYIVFHPGRLEHRFMGRGEALKRNMDLLCEVGDTATENGVQPCLENVYGRLSVIRRAREVRDFLKKCGSYRLAFDIPHAYIVGDVEDYLSGLVRRAVCIHISDNDGHRDLHLPLGRGVIPWEAYINRALRMGFRGPIVIENKDIGDALSSYESLKTALWG